jgi:hypothetical protein
MIRAGRRRGDDLGMTNYSNDELRMKILRIYE